MEENDNISHKNKSFYALKTLQYQTQQVEKMEPHHTFDVCMTVHQ
jgi:hypothetical protein